MDMTRLLRPLSLIALIGLILAVLASVTDRRVNAVAPPEVFLPDYGAALERAARLEITHGLAVGPSVGRPCTGGCLTPVKAQSSFL